eukprot:scaffold85266_cov33-Tisochrysis_lutea.AAC.5
MVHGIDQVTTFKAGSRTQFRQSTSPSNKWDIGTSTTILCSKEKGRHLQMDSCTSFISVQPNFTADKICCAPHCREPKAITKRMTTGEDKESTNEGKRKELSEGLAIAD